jgi:hypothetical protein
MRTTRIRTIYRLPEGPSAPAAAQRIAAHELAHAQVGAEAAESTELLLSELVHERRRNPGLMIDITRAGRNRWCVLDRGNPSLPGGLRSEALETLADSWGVSRNRGLTQTWFELHTSH